MPAETLPIIGSVASSFLNGVSSFLGSRSQREWDAHQLQLEREYNSPINQKNRLRQAGFNPALAMSNGMITSGNAGNAGGQTAPSYDFSPISHGMRDSVELSLQRRMNEAEISNQEEQTLNLAIRNRYENSRQIVELDKMIADKNLSDSQREYYIQERDRLKEDNKWIDKRNASQIAVNNASYEKLKAETAYQNLMNSYQSIVNEFAPKVQKQLLDNLRATGVEILASAAEHGAAAALKTAERVLTDAQKRGVDIDNEQKPRLAKALADRAVQQQKQESQHQ